MTRRFDDERASEQPPHPADDHDRLARMALRVAIALTGIVAVLVWALATGGVVAS